MPEQPSPPQTPKPATNLAGQARTSTTGIDNFVNFFQEGVLSPSKYNCQISYPDSMQGVVRDRVKTFQLAESITLPGRSLATLQRRTFGPSRDVPYERIFPGEIEVSFIMTPSTVGLHRIQFSQWMDSIISPTTNFVNVNRSNYVGQMLITLEDSLQQPIHSVEFLEVFPKAIQPISLSYGAENDYIRQTISFSFKRYIEAGDGNIESRQSGTAQLKNLPQTR